MMTQEQARLLCDAHEIYSLLENEEGSALLEVNNPELLEAYYELHRISVGADTVTNGGEGCAAQPRKEKNMEADPIDNKDLDKVCTSCCERLLLKECSNSMRPCGHHCNHSWDQDKCCWCGEDFGEEDVTL